MGGGVLPLEFGGEATAGGLARGPAGVGVGLEEAEVADGGFGEGRPGAASRGECRCASRSWSRGRAASRAGACQPCSRIGGPALGEPEFGAGVAVVVHEGEVLGAGDGAGGEGEGREVDRVAWSLVVEAEFVRRVGVGIGREADLGEAGVEGDPVEGRGDVVGVGCGRGFAVGRVERVGEEGVLDVGGDELLVLLLVLEAEGDAAGGFGVGGKFGSGFKQAGNARRRRGRGRRGCRRAAAGRSWRGVTSRACRRGSCSRS